MLSGGLFRECLISCPVLMARLKQHRLEGDGVLKTAELKWEKWWQRLGWHSEPPLFLCLHSLEQTSPNKLHDMWILRMQRESVSRTIKELQPRLQYRRRLHCLMSLRGTGGLVSQTRNGYLKPGGQSLVSGFPSYNINFIWLDADFGGRTYAPILFKPLEWYEKTPALRSASLAGEENQARTKQPGNKGPNWDTMAP